MTRSDRELIAFPAAGLTAAILLLIQTHYRLDCGIGAEACANPKPSLATIALLFSLITCATIFPLTLLVAKALTRVIAPAFVSGLAVAVSAWIDDSTVEASGFLASYMNMANQLFLPWLASSYLFVVLWPSGPFKPKPLQDSV
jgi:hypothetical protein